MDFWVDKNLFQLTAFDFFESDPKISSVEIRINLKLFFFPS